MVIFHSYVTVYQRVHPSTNLGYRQKIGKMWSIFRSKLRSSPQFLQHLQLDWPPVGSQGSPLRLRKDANGENQWHRFGTDGPKISKDLQRSPKISKVAKIIKKTSKIPAKKTPIIYLCCCSSGCLNLGKSADVRCHRMSQVHKGACCARSCRSSQEVHFETSNIWKQLFEMMLKYVEMMLK